MKKIYFIIGICSLISVATPVLAVQDFCSVALEIASKAPASYSRELLNDVIASECGIDTVQHMSAAFPITMPSFAPPSIPYCKDRSLPVFIICGNAVPVSCIWQCYRNEKWEHSYEIE